MQVPVILNGEKAILEGDCDDKLLTILRRKNLFSAKEGCEKGKCGFCAVLLDSKPVPSCIIPMGILRDAKIETLEHFSKSSDYELIMKGLDDEGIKLCGYCNASKIFAIYFLLKTNAHPSQNQINEVLDNMSCSCSDRVSLKKAIMNIIRLKEKDKKDGIL